jgi:Spy/CpxP family protein refolding chaperone
MKRVILLLALASPAAALAAVKTLPPEEQAALAEGGGAGMAKPAELNGYPGPKHVLELAEQLALTAAQRGRAEALFSAMQAQAVGLGAQVLGKEAALDRAFAERRAEPAAVEALVREIATLRGELRLVHLRTHFEMAGLLDPGQTQTYLRLRGHGHGAPQGGGHKH